jgi:hypothetical protein
LYPTDRRERDKVLTLSLFEKPVFVALPLILTVSDASIKFAMNAQNLSLCEYAEFLSLAIPVEIVQWIEIVFDAVAFFSLTFFIRTKYFRKVARLANANLKVRLEMSVC